MIKTLLCAALALEPSLAQLLAADAFNGSWKLDVARSIFASDNPAPRELTLTFSEQGASRIQILKGIAADGSATTTEWTAPLAGGTVIFPMGQGPAPGAALLVVDDRTLMLTANSPTGRTGAIRIYQLSDDGRTLTLTRQRQDGLERARMSFGRQ